LASLKGASFIIMLSTDVDEGLVDEPLHAIEKTARPARNHQG